MQKQKIFTSYFGVGKALMERKVVVVSTSLYDPRFGIKPNGKLKYLAPTANMLKMDVAEYVPLYKTILSKLNPDEVLADIKEISDKFGGADVALCCYEKPHEFCHRQLVKEWLNEHIEKQGLEIEKIDEYKF